jgi:hypothetical protein
MQEEELIRQLKAENEQLKREIELLYVFSYSVLTLAFADYQVPVETTSPAQS